VIPHLRTGFNARFTEAKHTTLLSRLDEQCGSPVPFRVSETPVFIPSALMRSMEEAGKAIILRLVEDPDFLRRSAEAIPNGFRAAGEEGHPLFVAVDFGITRDAQGAPVPRLIELQGFPTLFAYQPILTRLYTEVHDLPGNLTPFPAGITYESYRILIRRAIVGDHDPATVVLLEIDPLKQKTLPDFIATERLCGISIVNIRDVIKHGNRLFFIREGKEVPIRRIYNRVIADELLRLGAAVPFSFQDDLDVEWAGHPNWFFHLSKFSIPYLNHPLVPRTLFLADLTSPPENLERWVLKPLFSFAGLGVKVGPSMRDIETIPIPDRRNFILQERVEYQGIVDTPHGPTKAEVRIIYFWLDELRAVNNIVRMGRGSQMGVDFNKGLTWVGGSAGLRSEE
jgi:hypothetical protein